MQQPGRNGVPGAINGASPRLASSLPYSAVPGQSRPPLPQGMMNGVHPNNGQLPPGPGRGGNVPQAQMQSYLQGQQMIPPPDSNMRVIMEASRVQEQQRLLTQQRQQQYPPGGLSGASSSHLASLNTNPQTTFQATAGKLGSNVNGPAGPSRPSLSSGLAHGVQAQQLSGGLTPAVNHISAELKSRHPQASAEDLQAMTGEVLRAQINAQTARAATQAAAGNATSGAAPSQSHGVSYNAPAMNPQVYAQMLRVHHQRPGTGGSDINGARPGSRETRNPPPSSGGAGQSPRPPQAQMAGAP
jgi:hypothetical protein